MNPDDQFTVRQFICHELSCRLLGIINLFGYNVCVFIGQRLHSHPTQVRTTPQY